jgi:Uncharacterised ArCR, COG2043
MNSKVADAIGLKTHPVALIWSNEVPLGATCFTPGRWGCVMGLFAAAAAKGKVAAFGRQTYGCWGGGVGMGFGNCYETFPGGEDGFCGFLADGNNKTDKGQAIGEQLAVGAGQRMANDFLLGERYLKSSEETRHFLDSLPICAIPAEYVVIKAFEDADPEKDNIKSVTFFVDPDRLSALVILANYIDPDKENVIMPWSAGCQQIGIFAYRELELQYPRAVVGLTDISAREKVRPTLGRNVMSFTAPWPVFQKMEENVGNSFLQRETWLRLSED